MRLKQPLHRSPRIVSSAALAISMLACAAWLPAAASDIGQPTENTLSANTIVANDPATSIHRIRGFLPDLRFSLDGFQGKTITEKNLEGKVVLLFFGYASCPDICPTTMAQLSQVVHNLSEQADEVQIVFISVDPHRDTPEILNAYVSAFNDHAIGLTGTARQIADVARRYRVAYQIEPPTGNDPNSYEVTHARGIYIFDQKGRARFLASDSESIDSLTDSVRELLG